MLLVGHVRWMSVHYWRKKKLIKVKFIYQSTKSYSLTLKLFVAAEDVQTPVVLPAKRYINLESTRGTEKNAENLI